MNILGNEQSLFWVNEADNARRLGQALIEMADRMGERVASRAHEVPARVSGRGSLWVRRSTALDSRPTTKS